MRVNTNRQGSILRSCARNNLDLQAIFSLLSRREIFQVLNIRLVGVGEDSFAVQYLVLLIMYFTTRPLPEPDHRVVATPQDMRRGVLSDFKTLPGRDLIKKSLGL